ncbi:hypothetical protein HH214_10265 [Mucilaginibacter robiniae]|uniref:Uncharacterized protein n=1 Tax=Mucilaginibacter robiniae TaxID=2728022 RepID=A0A7L5E5T8_9SPHI|nr:hypothetical protein [Mucilaginibacter robiniae]QJD96223.1 hypothetical protein HH214_10265 [Mucilaginibacter robiniae]
MDIHALPCLRYESQTGKPMPFSYPENTGTIGELDNPLGLTKPFRAL